MKKTPEELALQRGAWIPCKGHTLPAYRRTRGGKLQDVVLVPTGTAWHIYVDGGFKKLFLSGELLAVLKAADSIKKASRPKKPRKG